MALFQKKRDPILDREARLKSELAEVQAQIRKLDAELRRQAEAAPKVRSTARPGQPAPAASPAEEAGLEDLRPGSAKNPFDAPPSAPRFNPQGAARFDLVAWARRWFKRRPGSAPSQPRNAQLITYLAAGGVEGLPALRHERRVARNRFLLICAVLVIVFLGLFYWWPR